jgi:hypothetical protein
MGMHRHVQVFTQHGPETGAVADAAGKQQRSLVVSAK